MSIPGTPAPTLTRRAETTLRWRAGALHRSLTGTVALGFGMALVLGRTDLVLLVAPTLGLLLVPVLARPPARVRVRWWQSASVVVEGDRLEVAVDVAGGPVTGVVEGEVLTARMPCEGTARSARGRTRWTLVPRRWGRWRIGPVRLRLHDRTGLLTASTELALQPLTVYPGTPGLSLLPPLERTARTLGEHVARALGAGAEPGSVREIAWGDRARDINWAVSSRRDELYVTERRAEHAWDVVVAVDTFSDVGTPGRRTLDIAVRGAAATAAGYLHHHDRVGLVVLGGYLRWLTPDNAQRQLYRILDQVLDLPGWDSVVDPALDRVPRQVFPPRSLVVVFSPLLDERAVHLVTELAGRALQVLVVDVLSCEPRAGSSDLERLALRMWRLERLALRHQLTGLGVHVVRWDDEVSLEPALAPLQRAHARVLR